MAIETTGVRLVMLGLGTFQRNASIATTSLTQIRTAAGLGSNALVAAGTKIASVGQALIGVGSAMTLGFTVPFLAATGLATKAAIDYEDALFGVGKTMDIVISIIGIVFIVIAVVYLLKPEILKRVMVFFKHGRRLYFTGVLRFALAIT